MVVGVIALLAVVISWRAVTLGLADLWAVSSPDRALFWRPEHPGALRHAAEDRFNSRDYAAANVLARRGIEAYALDGRNYRVVASIADARGDEAHALPLFRIAAERSPRDLQARQKLAEYALKSGDADEAIRQLDLIMRLDVKLWPDLLLRMVRLAEFPTTEPAFVHALTQRPNWRAQFLVTLALKAQDAGAVDRIYRRLDSTSKEEMTAWIDRLIRDRDWEQAYMAWVSSLPVSQHAALGNVFDGDFAFPPSDGGFGWQMPPAPGADVQTVGSANAGAGKSLSVDFYSANMTFRHVSQLLVLGPGRYVLRGKAKSDGLDTGRGLQWVLACAEGQQQVLASSPLLVGTQPWRDFEMPFEVPAGLCGGQLLRLQMGAPDRISGHAGYSSLSVERVGDSAKSDGK
jgi:tetratricopeptide (TPR) repeat protein